jgi:hypothetical protein
LYAKKKGLILGPIPEIPVPVAQDKELGYPDFGLRFWPKMGKSDWVDTPIYNNNIKRK